MGKGFLVVIALIVGIVFLVLSGSQRSGGPPPTPASYVPDNFAAYSICKDFVLDRLKAPKTAQFAGFDDAKVHDLGGGDYEVIGFVDAQNAFGAQIRERYLCKVHYKGDRNWRLNGLVFK